MVNKLYKQIYKTIKKYDKIVLARHVGADPDALGSTLGLKDIIKKTFPNKKVIVVGAPASRFNYLGVIEKMTDDMYDGLLIVLDTPDKGRVDGVDVDKFKKKIKIDHHPFVEEFCDIECIDDSASSASQLVIDLTYATKLKMTDEAAIKLYTGLVADTDRFLFSYTTSKTFQLVSRLMREHDIDFGSLYTDLYTRPLKEVKFEGYIANNLKVTENGFAYAVLDEDILNEYDVDAATAGNMVNNFNYIDGIYAWAVFSYDKNNKNIRGSIRSRGPVINEAAAMFGGGGHKCASGVRLTSFDDVDKLVEKLDEVCLKYQEESK